MRKYLTFVFLAVLSNSVYAGAYCYGEDLTSVIVDSDGI